MSIKYPFVCNGSYNYVQNIAGYVQSEIKIYVAETCKYLPSFWNMWFSHRRCPNRHRCLGIPVQLHL